MLKLKKKKNITIQIVGKFSFLSCGGSHNTQSFIIYVLTENVGIYNSLLLHCAPPPPPKVYKSLTVTLDF